MRSRKRRRLAIPHRHRRLLTVVHPYPAILSVAGSRVLAILFADLRQAVGADGVAAGLDVNAEQAGGVQAEDLILDLIVQGGVFELVHELLRHAQAAEALDLALRAAAPDRI